MKLKITWSNGKKEEFEVDAKTVADLLSIFEEGRWKGTSTWWKDSFGLTMAISWDHVRKVEVLR